jgi:hypothetical protein
MLLHSIPAKNTATAAVNDSDTELTPVVRGPAVMDTEIPIQATSDAELTMVVVTPKGDFYKTKVVYVQWPVQETSPPVGNDELVP